MARHFTWCINRTFLFANRINTMRQFTPARKVENLPIEKYITVNEINVDYDEPKDFDEFVKDTKTGKNLAIDVLIKLLSVSKANATRTVNQYPAFKKLPKKMILMNFQCLRKAGINKSNINDNKFILTDHPQDLQAKIAIVKKLNLDINDAVHLFHLTVRELVAFEQRTRVEASYLPGCNRIQYLAEKFQIDEGKMCHLMSYYPHMLHVPAPKLLTVTEMLLEAGFPRKCLLADLYIYSYSVSTIKSKIERAKSVGLDPLKPWIFRCSESIWEKAIEKQSQRTMILKSNQTIQEHLCEIFDCDLETVNHVISKNQMILSTRIDKVSSIARLLKKEGYGIADVQRTPRIMYRSYTTLKELFQLSKKLGLGRLPLFRFLFSKKKLIELLPTENEKSS